MRKVAFLAALVGAVALPAMAQETPRVELFGGVSYNRFDVSNIKRVDLRGWSAAAGENLNHWFGGEFEVSGYYRSPNDIVATGETDHMSLYTYLFGPRISLRKSERLTPYVHVLLGVAHISVTREIATVLLEPPLTSNAFAAAFGGGVDFKVTKHLAVRLIQVDYLATRFDEIRQNLSTGEIGFIGLPRIQNNIRGSAGLVLRLGKR